MSSKTSNLNLLHNIQINPAVMTIICFSISSTQTVLWRIVTSISSHRKSDAKPQNHFKILDPEHFNLNFKSILFLRRFPHDIFWNTQQKAITLNNFEKPSLPKRLEFNHEYDDSIRFSLPDTSNTRVG